MATAQWEMQCVLSHPIPWDIFHGNPISMDKPGNSDKQDLTPAG